MNILPFDHLFKPAPVKIKTIADIKSGEVFVWKNEHMEPMLKLQENSYLYLHGSATIFDANVTCRFGHEVIRLRHSLHIEGIEP